MTELSERSKFIRRETIKLSKANGGYHYGGCFSCVEILLAIFDHEQPGDRFIMSKGHACWPFYVLLRERGLNPLLEGHPKLDPANGVNFTTGSMGHGMPAAAGMALARKIAGKPGEIIVLIGDGECQEGTTWETMLIAAQHHLRNLTVIVDCNGIQGSGFVDSILTVDAIGKCAEAIGWKVINDEVDGHSVYEIQDAIRRRSWGPTLILANTVKGRGVSFMENKPEWHAKWLDDKHEALAMEELK